MSIYKAYKLLPENRYSNYIKPWTKHSSNPILNPGTSGQWDDNWIYGADVIKDESDYKMWYCASDGSNDRIGYATSGDSVTWTKSGSNPVLNLGGGGQWDDSVVDNPCVIKDGTDYKMWYTGAGTTGQIGYATSGDGIAWTKSGSNPILTVGTGGQWDDAGAIYPAIVKDGPTDYKMWYSGNDGSNYRIGYATSGDGIAWTKYGSNPILDLGTGGQWDDAGVSSQTVIKDGSYKMWYMGFDGANQSIGYATSGDGISWSKYGSVLAVGNNTEWDDTYLHIPRVLKDNNIYRMYYGG